MGRIALRVAAAVVGVALLVVSLPMLTSSQHSLELAAKALGAAILLLAVLPYGGPRARTAAREGHPEDEL